MNRLGLGETSTDEIFQQTDPYDVEPIQGEFVTWRERFGRLRPRSQVGVVGSGDRPYRPWLSPLEPRGYPRRLARLTIIPMVIPGMLGVGPFVGRDAHGVEVRPAL